MTSQNSCASANAVAETPARQQSNGRTDRDSSRRLALFQDSFRDFMKREVKRAVWWAANGDVLALPRKLLKPVVLYALRTKRDFALLFYDTPERKPVIDLIDSIRGETEMLMSNN